MVVTMGDERQRQHTSRGGRVGGRVVRRESDARRDLERMHLMTIRREKMRLHNELERVRVKKKNTYAGTNAKLLSNRFGMTSLESNGDDGRRRTMLSSANGGSRAVSPNTLRRNMRTAGQVGSFDHELPLIGLMPSPLKGELDMRRQKDESRDPNNKLNELKKNEGRQKNLLSLKVDMFTRSLSPASSRSPARSPAPSISPKPPTEDGDSFPTNHDSRLKRNESDLETRVSFPPSSRKKMTRASIADYDVGDAKHSISKRLMSIEAEDGNLNFDPVAHRSDDAFPRISPVTAPAPLPRRPSIIRRESQAAILERYDPKKNKYASVSASAVNSNNNNQTSSAPKKVIDTDVSLSTLGREAKRVKQIIENPEIVFDQEKYAPDGALRTVHMMPDADSAYSQARKARYLRWRDPNETDYDRELSINDIFSKGK